MNPIYEYRSRNKGVGYALEEFPDRFAEICNRHMATGRAKAFAFIFCRADDWEFSGLLQDHETFTHLDRLCGHKLSVFYIQGREPSAQARFNDTFLNLLGIKEEARLPCVVFFRVNNEGIYDLRIAQLETPTQRHGFHELHSVLGNYIESELHSPSSLQRGMTFLGKGTKIIASQAFQAILGRFFQSLVS